MARKFPMFRSERKKRTTSVGSIQVLNRVSRKLRCLLLRKIIRKFRLKVKWNKHFFLGKSDERLQSTSRYRPLFPFGTERRKFPYHFVNFQFPVFHQPTTVREIEFQIVSAILFCWFPDFGETLTIIRGWSQPYYSNE